MFNSIYNANIAVFVELTIKLYADYSTYVN